jgi:ADP-ribose pyrophosphatase YjhB (NUDIX family)
MTKIDNQIQQEILTTIKFLKDGGKYSDLRIKDIENDLYNYHLQHLVKNGYIEKSGDLYKLTELGKSLVTNIDEEDKKLPANYKVSVYICVVIDGKILLSRRLKHPQYGYVGLPSGKIRYGEEILETAKRELQEETELSADFKIIGNLRQIRTNNQGVVVEDGVFYICYTDKVTGKLLLDSNEGKNFWVKIDEVTTLEKLFKPSVEIVINGVIKRLKGEVGWESQFIYELKPEPEDY